MGSRVTDFLFAKPCFLYGLGRVVDLGANFDQYNRSLTPQEADQWALASDWAVVRQDLANAWYQVQDPGLTTELETVTLQDPALLAAAWSFLESAPSR